jgi:hypothetical protein
MNAKGRNHPQRSRLGLLTIASVNGPFTTVFPNTLLHFGVQSFQSVHIHSFSYLGHIRIDVRRPNPFWVADDPIKAGSDTQPLSP